MYFNLVLALFFLIAAVVQTAMSTALLKMGRIRAKEEFKKHRSLFFFFYFLKPLFPKNKWDGVFFTLSFSKHVLHLCYSVLALFILLVQDPFLHVFKKLGPEALSLDAAWIVGIGTIIILVSLVSEIGVKLIASAAPYGTFKCFSPLSSIFLILFSPLTALFLKILQAFFPHKEAEKASSSLYEKISELLYESELSHPVDPQEKKLLLSVASFKERIAREVMVPRIDVFTVSEDISIQTAANIFLKEGYSRIPVYQDNVDHIIGVLLYKDVLGAFAGQKNLGTSIKSLIKPVLYTPETKKISTLLQEFKSKHLHLAIVVDEYGGTEGIVTIEDILEELVGEIGDEYDEDQEILFSILPSGGWIVDARMNILDIEKELGIKIPSSPEYDTLGGYIFHKAGAIPSVGWRIHQDEFDLEILSSDDRSIEKIRITPLSNKESFPL